MWKHNVYNHIEDSIILGGQEKFDGKEKKTLG